MRVFASPSKARGPITLKFIATSLIALACGHAQVLAAQLLSPKQVEAECKEIARSAKKALPKVGPIAYAFMVGKKGEWIPTFPADADRLRRIIDAKPAYLRVGTASNDCPLNSPDEECFTGLPSPDVEGAFLKLQANGIQLGVAINVWKDNSRWTDREGIEHKGRVREAREVVQHACRIRKADLARANASSPRRDPFYSFIFLDFALSRPRGLQDIVRKIQTGESCLDGLGKRLGYRRVMTNDTRFGSKGAALARHAWAHAKRFELLDGDGPVRRRHAARAANGEVSVLTRQDIEFIGHIRRNYPASLPVLKLEVPHQTGYLSLLKPGVQKALLKEWARLQHVCEYKMIYPLFVHDVRTSKDGPGEVKLTPYDSWAEGTYELQKLLMRRDR